MLEKPISPRQMNEVVRTQAIDQPLVYILVLNWRSAADTIACVESVLKLDYPNYRILVIDNDSQDGSERVIRDRFTSLEFIQTGRNSGYAGGNNQGMLYALKKEAEYIWILNPDVRVKKDSLSKMVNLMLQDESVGLCGPRILEGMHENYMRVDGGKITPSEGYRFEHLEASPGEEAAGVKEVDYVIGCSLLIRARVLHDAGLFREDFFWYSDDVEFCFRVRKLGWKTVILMKAENFHYVWQGKKDEPHHNFYAVRSRIILARLEKKYLGKTILSELGYYFLEDAFRGSVSLRTAAREVYYRIMRHSVPVISALCCRLKKIPRVIC